MNVKYTTYCGNQLQTKNKLQKNVAIYLNELDRTLVEQKDLKFVKSEIIKKIKELNEQHKNCRPIDASWFPLNKKDILLSGVHFSNFQLHQINKFII